VVARNLPIDAEAGTPRSKKKAFANFDNRLVILQYANDTVLCIKHNPKQALNFNVGLYV
jgi:hypothetical protein